MIAPDLGLLPLVGMVGFVLPLITSGLSALGVLGKGRAKGRQEEAEQARQQAELILRQAEFNRETPRIRAGDAVRGDVLAGVQPARLSGEGRNLSYTGGLSPALLSEGTRGLGREMARQAMLSQMGGAPRGPQRPVRRGKFAGAVDRARNRQAGQMVDASPYARLMPPDIPQGGGLLDKFLGAAGIAGGALGMFNEARSGPFRTPPYRSPVPAEQGEYDDIYGDGGDFDDIYG